MQIKCADYECVPPKWMNFNLAKNVQIVHRMTIVVGLQ